MRKKVVIMGAAGRDFHNFNVCFRESQDYEVVAFTATQIPDITGKRYPKELSGKLYPDGIPIREEKDLERIIEENSIDEVILAYSDLAYDYIMHRASLVNKAGADFRLMGTKSTMLKSKKPVIAVCAVRTGCGKSQTSRRILHLLKDRGYKVVSVRHPMPYDPDLVKQKCQRFATYEDLDKHNCTIEEREEYEPYIDMGAIVYAGIDYAEILAHAEEEADVIIWDGGNNDFPFFKPDLMITIADPHRPGDEIAYYPGEVNLLLADVVIINKVQTAKPEDIETVRENIKEYNPGAIVIEAASNIIAEDGERIRGKKVLVVEDGPTVTHGGMAYGSGYLAAKRHGAAQIVDPRPFAVGSIKTTFKKYDHLDQVLPAMGYGGKQKKDLEETINKAECDIVVSGTPIDLSRVVSVNKDMVRIMYELQEIGKPDLEDVIERFLKR